MRAQDRSARAHFERALGELASAPQNTQSIQAELAAVQLQWEWFRSALTMRGAPQYPLVVADASESVLRAMESITELYQSVQAR